MNSECTEGVAGLHKGNWHAISLKDILASTFDVDLGKRLSSLRERVEKLRQSLTDAPIDVEDVSAPVAASQRVIELKRRRHKLSEDASTSRSQVKQTEVPLESLEDLLSAAEDLFRLKTIGIGRIAHIECPTCHRDLDPATFALNSQSSESIENHIEALKRDRDLLSRNLMSMKATLSTIYSELKVVSSEFREAERAFMNVTSAVGTVREALAQAATELASTKRSIDRVLEISKNIVPAQLGSMSSSASTKTAFCPADTASAARLSHAFVRRQVLRILSV